MQELQDIAEKSLNSILKTLGFEGNITVAETAGNISLNIDSPDSNYLIGDDGSRLDDLQYLVNRMIQLRLPDAPRVRVDCNNYREQSESRLLEKVRRVAEKVIETGKSQRLQPLNAYHRRLVHNALQEMGGITTTSEEGDARYKRITINPA